MPQRIGLAAGKHGPNMSSSRQGRGNIASITRAEADEFFTRMLCCRHDHRRPATGFAPACA